MKKLLILVLFLGFSVLPGVVLAESITLLYPPGWKAKLPQAKAIAATLSESTGLEIRPLVAKSYPQIVEAFAENRPVLVYVGSFVQAILHARDLSVPIGQVEGSRKLYSSVLIAPDSAGDDPVAIVQDAGSSIAYARGASSGESGAKAASAGVASFGTNNHKASLNAIKVGKAKAAFVKNWWWEGNKDKFPGMKKLDYPGVSDHMNPDNVLAANKAVASADLAKIKEAAFSNAAVFGADSMAAFDTALLDPSLDLMRKGKIDPLTYAW